ncbi:tetratricopeptide repeat protein 19, mitochondrial [Ahaetulla prasina]|uniref:tetratricopeptide repeat protein 19, mitochondrial n=1 Tax=Ahaetulla prasina TaxID=499056 RepID=UPI0026484EC9|nr:tetratricopeptide repeat protein 19, mitochondrial [Ahaetulla prasina]
MSLLSSLLLRLPQRGLVTAAVAARHRLTQTRPRPVRNGGLCRRTPRQAAAGGAFRVGSGLSLSAFFLFSGETEKEEEGEEGKDKADPEDAIILLLKKAKLKIMKGELEEAERLLHEASWLSQQSKNNAAIIYTYDMMANLAFLRGELEKAEKLFKATMSYMLAGDVKQDDNAILQMSLKLASIYAAQNQDKLALAGYQFCILTLEEKVAKQKEMPADTLPEEERVNTHLLLAMSLDSYARYLLAHHQTTLAQTMYERALKIAMEVNGEKHPQTVVVMNDLGTALDAQGLYNEAYAQVSRAAELAQQTQHTDTHVILNNLAGILIHKGDYSQARQVYKKALEVAEKSGDGVAVRYITKELAQLAKRKRTRSKGEDGLQEAEAGKEGADGQKE